MYFCPYLNQQTGQCNIGNICYSIRRCSQIQSYYNPNSYENCKLFTGGNMKNYRFIYDNLIYIDVQRGDDTFTITVPNIYGENVPDIIDIVEYNGKYYIKGQEPKKEEKKIENKKSNKEKE